MIPLENTVVAMTSLGYVKRMTIDNFKVQHRGGRGIKGMQTIMDDYIEDLLMLKTHDYIMFFTNKGRVYRLKAYQIPEASRNARGTAIVNLLQLDPEESISAIIPIEDFDAEKNLFMVTKNGIVKKTAMKEFRNIRKNGLIAIDIREGDELIEVKSTVAEDDVFLVTKKGMCIRFKETDVRATGRSSMGVIGMKFNKDDEIVGMQLAHQGEALLIVSEKGYGKRTSIDEFHVQNRGGRGVHCYKIVEKTGDVVGVKAVNEDHEIMMITDEGIIIQIPMEDVSMIGRSTSGVRLMKVDGDVKIAKIAKVREKVSDEDGNEESLDDDEDIIEEDITDEELKEDEDDES
nr:DNA gyrase subunit A [Lachnospiraceae bacterium]